MQAADSDFSRACGEITGALLAIDSPSRNQVRSEVRRACAKYSLERIPRNHEILATVAGTDFERLRGVLVKKPVKTASGVAVIAVMPMPYGCPHGRCTYCPGGVEIDTPNSYTGREPSTVNAIENGYDPKKQIAGKLKRLAACGHDTSKIELVLVGGTFLFMPEDYQRGFVKSCYDALNGSDSSTLEEAKERNAGAACRNVGFTIETKPDYCRIRHVDSMLGFGVTRVEIGVQSLRDEVYRRVNRGHTYRDVLESFRVSKDAGYKIVAHMMPGLPGATPDGDIADLARLFEDPDLRPDMLKIYPSLVIRGTPMYDDYASGRYAPYSDDEMIRVLAEAKKTVPRWARIMRIQREISPGEIVAGPRTGNLRQLVLQELERQGEKCRCIRCREAGLGRKNPGTGELGLNRTDYASSGGRETFLSYDDAEDSVYGFLRLRSPGGTAHRREVGGDACIVRELHVYGRSIGIGQREPGGIQHSGLGRGLLARAERIAAEDYDARRMLVISAVGTRGYYGRLGYRPDGPYMAKRLR